MFHEVLFRQHSKASLIESEVGEEPDKDRCEQDDRSRLPDEGPAALPHGVQDGRQCRHMIFRKLHDKRSRIACETLCLLEDDTRDDDCGDTDEVCAPADPCGIVEHRTCDQGNDRKFRTAWNEGRCHDRHTAVTLVFNRTACHDTRNTASGTDHHRDEGFAGETELTEDTVHDECDTRHVSAAFQEGQEEEQNEHLRNKSDDRADTGNDTVNDQSVEPGTLGNADGIKQAADCARYDFTEEHIIRPVGCHGADGLNGDIVYQPHDKREDRKRQPAVGHDTVDLVRGGHLSGTLLLIGAFQHLLNRFITVVGDDGFRVIVKRIFHCLCDCVRLVYDVGGKLQLFDCLVIALKYLDRIEPLLILTDIEQRSDFLNRIFNGLVIYDRFRLCAVLCGSDRRFGSFHYAVAFQSGDLYDLAAKICADPVKIDHIAALCDKVHHVYRHDHRNTGFRKLCCEIQVALQVGSVNDIEDRIRLLIDQVVTGDNFLQRIRRQGVDARKVFNDDIRMSLQFAFFFLNRYARPVSDKLIRAGQRVEQCCLSAVRVSRKCDYKLFTHNSFPLFYSSTSIISASYLRIDSS